ncbi:MAG: hypothetical protein F9K22_15005 [Bacteroidetes bacterium]|nr:MAG: hypothetical protein F9K22_15005 [Bacteroidota bacterium]
MTPGPIAIVLLSLLLASCGPIWTSLPPLPADRTIVLSEPILTSAQYSERAPSHPRPYVVTMADSLVLFGAEHTKDPADPQLDSIIAQWDRLRPTVALVEGRLGLLFRWTSDPVKAFGEGGRVVDVAKSGGIRCYTWEPSQDDEVAWMLERYPPKRVALFYILRPYFGQVRHDRPEDPDGWIEGTIARRTRWRGLEGTIAGTAELDSIWRTDFTGRKDWRDTDDRYGWPGYLDELAARSNAYRDEHFARVIVGLVRNGERVFAVCGSSHAVKLERALRSTLAAP